MSEHEVDITGMICPLPVMEITKIARTLNPGDKLTIIMGANGKTNVEGWASGNNFEITDFTKEDDKIVFKLEKQND